MRRGWMLALTLLALAPARAAQAQDPPSGAPINTNRYNVELFQGPTLAPLRITGLGGAYGPYAEGSDGIPANAAAPAVREPFSVGHFDWDLNFSVSFPGAFRNTDFNNDGRVGFAYNDYVFYTLGGMIQVGRFAIGVLGDFQRYNLSPNAQPTDPRSTLTLGRIHALAGLSFFNNQLNLGAGARGVWLNIDSTTNSSSQNVLRMLGAAPEAGVLIKPDYLPWRIGATFRFPVNTPYQQGGSTTYDAQGVQRAAGLAVPQNVYLPWELQAGFAIQVGPRPLNPKWIDPGEQEDQGAEAVRSARAARRIVQQAELAVISDPAQRERRAAEFEREEAYLQQEEDIRLRKMADQMAAERRARYWNWPREYILVVAEALVTGATPNAVGLESFLSQTVERSGQNTTVTPRLGLEGEPVVGSIKTRIGTYLEPGRYTGSSSRQHFTFGFDIRVFEFKGYGILAPATYRISGMADLAPRYENFGVSFGAWH
ncbi:MAG: hypothetical protein HY898_10880 [Deltaproteobacteria bacterium]|nr:hypothetical protein [Deltaproteobacteria bacterium]